MKKRFVRIAIVLLLCLALLPFHVFAGASNPQPLSSSPVNGIVNMQEQTILFYGSDILVADGSGLYSGQVQVSLRNLSTSTVIAGTSVGFSISNGTFTVTFGDAPNDGPSMLAALNTMFQSGGNFVARIQSVGPVGQNWSHDWPFTLAPAGPDCEYCEDSGDCCEHCNPCDCYDCEYCNDVGCEECFVPCDTDCEQGCQGYGNCTEPCVCDCPVLCPDCGEYPCECDENGGGNGNGNGNGGWTPPPLPPGGGGTPPPPPGPGTGVTAPGGSPYVPWDPRSSQQSSANQGQTDGDEYVYIEYDDPTDDDLGIPVPPEERRRRVIRFEMDNLVYTIDTVPHTNDVAPFVDPAYDRTMIPLRAVSEALGAEVEWIGATRTVLIFIHDETQTLVVDVSLPGGMGVPVIISDRVLVPLRFVAERLGAEVRWDGANRAAYVYMFE